MCRNPGCSLASHCQYLRRGQLQASCWKLVRQHHGQQERVGIWIFQVHHSVERGGWVSAALLVEL